MERLFVAALCFQLACGALGYIIGGRHGSATLGGVSGLVLGPIGVLVIAVMNQHGSDTDSSLTGMISRAELRRRWMYLAGLYVWVVVVTALVVGYGSYTTTTTATTSGGTTASTSGSTTLLQTDRGPALVIIFGLLIAAAVASLSFMHRVRRGYAGRTFVGYAAALAVTAFAVLGLMTVGIVLIPAAVLLWLLAGPFHTVGESPPASVVVQ